MTHIQEPESPWEVFYIDWVTEIPPSGDRGYDNCSLVVEEYRNTPPFSPLYADDTAMDITTLLWNRCISHSGIFNNVISDRDPKFTSEL
ncbi:hypothetical protein O181_030768 [Austropuccinia psidii MF-1]|uniref:Integrase catalytic domain-containing protein n=1 Tax=Austropuccinia psidii MF-1 TaxID=1389203 RepID=A0A9Q3CYB0_9BASI|nr:hypothetical protein [Austropuccinia psidii MF-1]